MIFLLGTELSSVERVLRQHGAQYVTWVARFSDACTFHHVHLTSLALAHDWVVWADTDEFHDLNGQTVDTVIDKLEGDGAKVLSGRMIDRVAADGRFPRVHALAPLDEQFPLRCDITGAVMQACRDKVMLAGAHVYLTDGHHFVKDMLTLLLDERFHSVPRSRPMSAKQRGGGIVNHFKWISGVEDYLEKMRSLGASPAGTARMSQAIGMTSDSRVER